LSWWSLLLAPRLTAPTLLLCRFVRADLFSWSLTVIVIGLFFSESQGELYRDWSQTVLLVPLFFFFFHLCRSRPRLPLVAVSIVVVLSKSLSLSFPF
jgi:hypothetical protein